MRFGTLSARERPSHSASSPRVASVWRRHSQKEALHSSTEVRAARFDQEMEMIAHDD